MNSLSPRERVMRALRQEPGPGIPFTVYESKLPQCAAERALRNRGLCIVERRVNAFKIHRPNIRIRESSCMENGHWLTRTEYETPRGTLHSIHEKNGFTTWVHKRLFTDENDYPALRCLIEDEAFSSNDQEVRRAQEALGEDVILRGTIGLEPMQELISGLMGTEAFCLEIMDREEEVMGLYEALVENRRRRYPLAAASPLEHFNYGGNVTPEIIGLKRFRDYYVPHYEECAEVLHRNGKLLGVHFDANCGVLREAIASTPLDYIEAFTPAPSTDMTLAEARAAWPDKALWINYPSATHLASNEAVRQMTESLVAEADGFPGFIMGITEDVPEFRWRESFTAIMDGLEAHERKPMASAS